MVPCSEGPGAESPLGLWENHPPWDVRVALHGGASSQTVSGATDLLRMDAIRIDRQASERETRFIVRSPFVAYRHVCFPQR